MANHASHGALPYPVKNARYTVLVPMLDADGDPLDGTTPDTEVSKDNGAFTDAAEEVAYATGARGMGMLTLTGAETDSSILGLWAGVASGPKATLMTLFPRVLPTLETGTAQAGAAGSITLAAGAAAYDLTGCIVRTTGGTGGGGAGGANNQARLITAYNTSTKVATVVPNWETTPDGTTTYDVLLTEMAVNALVTRALRPTTDGRTIDVSAGGEAGLDWANIGSPTTAQALTGTTVDLVANAVDSTAIANDAITAAKIAAGAIDAATFAAGAIDAAAIADGAIDAATFAAGAINAAAIATGAIDADALASDAVTEMRSLISGTSDSGTTTTMVDAARTEADTDYWAGDIILFTSGTIANQARIITAFDPATDTITFTPATTQAVATQTYEILAGSRAVLAGITHTSARIPNVTLTDTVTTYTGNTLQTGDSFARLGAPTGASVSVDIAGVQSDTDNMQTRLPAALVGGRMDSSVGAMAVNVVTAAAIADGAIDAATFAAGAIDAAAIANAAIDAATFAAGAIDNAAFNVTETLTANPAAGGITAASFAAGAIDAAAIATNAIDADALATDAVNEIRDAILNIVTGTADAGSTASTIVDAERTEATTDYWQHGVVEMTSGPNIGQIRRVTAFNAATDTLTMAPAFKSAVAAGNTYRIIHVLADGLRPVTEGNEDVDVDSAGDVGTDVQTWGDVAVNALLSGRVDASVGAMAANVVTAAAIADGAIDAATFAAGAIDNTAFNVTETLTANPAAGGITSASFAAGAITAAVIATGAIDADALAADAVTELRSLVSGTADSGSTTTMVDAARTEADTDYWAGDVLLFTSGSLNGQARIITAFDPALDQITFTPATTQAVATHTYEIIPGARAILAGITHTSARIPNVTLTDTVTTYTGNTPQTGDSFVRLGAPAGASMSVDIAGVQSDTNDLQTRIPAALVSGRMDSSVGAMAANVVTAAAIADGAIDAATFAAGAINAAAIATDAIGSAELAASAANKIADHTLRRTYANARLSADGDALSFRSLLGAIGKLINRWSITGTTLTVYQEDDATSTAPGGTQTITATAGADPITQLDTT